VKILLDVRTRSRGLEDNFRYWLLHYRAVCEAFSVIEGPLSLEVLYKEAETARAALRRLEPEYGQYLHRFHTPGRDDMWWARTANAMLKHENSFV
jgi:hypothetical protein